MNITPALPPRFFTWLLKRAVQPSTADEVLGDLHEEFVRMRMTRGDRQARVWYAVQSVRLAGRMTADHIARGASSASRPRPASHSGDSVMSNVATETLRAFRSLMKRPALTALIVVPLALGLGANAAIFALIDAVILRPFTIPGVDQVVMIAQTAPDGELDIRETVAPANYFDWKKSVTSVEHMAAFDYWDVNLAGGDASERVSGFYVTADFFAALNVAPAIGRAFLKEEETPGRHQRVILSHDLWQRRFASDPAITGKTVQLDTVPYEIVGVAPEGFNFPLGADLWAPLALDAAAAATRSDRYLSVIGRLAPGRHVEDAAAEVTVVGQRLEQQYPEANRQRGARAMTLTKGMQDRGLGPIANLWQAAAGFVLLIACANIANLLLARGVERQRELAVRTALGASRLRLVREMLIESSVLALLAVPAALAVAWVGVRLIRVNLPSTLVRYMEGWQRIDVDGRLIAFTIGLAVLTAILFGIMPAIRASRPHLTETLKDGGRGASSGRQRQRLRHALVIAEIALALPLLVASGMTTLGSYRFLYGSQGYEPDGLLMMRAVLPDARYLEPEARRRFVADMSARLVALPGVKSVAISNVLPATGSNSGRAIELEGVPNPDPANPPMVDNRVVNAAYLSTLGIPLLRGRNFSAADTADSLPVAIISRSTAEKHFPGADPIGRRIKIGSSPLVTIVGISGDVIHDWFSRRDAPTVYRPYDQAPSGYLAIGVRADGDLSALIPPVRGAVRALDPAQALFEVRPMTVALSERTIGLQYVAAIMAIFGMLALVLAVVGVYSLMAFIITQRTHEIGVRIALGANHRDVLRLTVGQALRMTAIGVTIGLLLSAAMGRGLEAALVGVISSDIRLSLGFAAVLVLAAVSAGYLPARRATGIDPIAALRAE